MRAFIRLVGNVLYAVDGMGHGVAHVPASHGVAALARVAGARGFVLVAPMGVVTSTTPRRRGNVVRLSRRAA